MFDTQHRHLFIICGACGTASFMLYVLLLALGLSDAPSQFELSRTFLLAATWPVLGIVFSYALYRLIAIERQGTPNRPFHGLRSVVGMGGANPLVRLPNLLPKSPTPSPSALP
jgi:hypothetical protein